MKQICYYGSSFTPQSTAFADQRFAMLSSEFLIGYWSSTLFDVRFTVREASLDVTTSVSNWLLYKYKI